MTAVSEYQRLRSHLAFLRMAAAAEALPGALDQAAKTKLSHTAFLERLLAVEVAAVEQCAWPAWPVPPRCHPPSPWPTSTSAPNRRSTPN